MWQQHGFTQHSELKRALEELEMFLYSIPGLYATFSLLQLIEKPAPGKWSKQEILGHLIDSALNNLKRFTEIPLLPQPYTVQSYSQDELVVINRYQQLPLEHLIALWSSLNLQILHVASALSAEMLQLVVYPQYNDRQSRTLEWLICDYVAHMKHHVKQLM